MDVTRALLVLAMMLVTNLAVKTGVDVVLSLLKFAISKQVLRQLYLYLTTIADLENKTNSLRNTVCDIDNCARLTEGFRVNSFGKITDN